MLDAVQTLRDLIRIDTANPPGDEMRLLAVLRDILVSGGAQVALQPLAHGRRGNLVARLPGKQQGLAPLVLLSHVDVVPANPAAWTHPPFAAVVEDGYIYGRGAVDTKQLTVMELSAFLALGRHTPLERDVYLVATGDEECGSALGLQSLLAGSVTLGGREIAGRTIFQDAQVISEGGGFPVLAGKRVLYLLETGQKGCGQITFHFREAGGVYLTGTGALRRACGLVQALHQTELPANDTATLQRFADVLSDAHACRPDQLQARLSPMMGNILKAMRHNTLTPTLVQGKNLQHVSVVYDVRLLPGLREAKLMETVNALAGEWGADVEVGSLTAGYESDPGDALPLLEACLRAELPPAQADVALVPFLSMGSSDGRYLKGLAAGVYGFSPVLPWDMTFEQAVRMVHGVDERIHCDSLDFGCRVLTRAVRRLAVAAEREAL